ncbi:phosphotransferase family protein [Deinococcus sonorensis]|uniref:Phosphotransferase n=2 Tax=Deinococcus sonorensis TaxID=309891 RepID=A0AAU7UGW4_9DEIO
MEPPRPYAVSLTLADLPDEVRAMLAADTPLQEPPRQGRTSRVAFALDASGRPVVLKRSVGPHLEVIRREHRALCAVHPLGVPAPEPLLFLERAASAGLEGWLMTRRLPGITLEAALGAELDRAGRTALLTNFGAHLARLHATPPPPGLGGHDCLETVLASARRLNPAADVARFDPRRNRPPAPVALAFIHGDLFLVNVMTEGGRVTGLIDWSFAEVGDPRSDVAVAMHGLTRADQAAFAEGYGPAGRLTPAEAAYFVELALLF